ncbi:hypothetical protein BJI69_11405 [Luteibacter rhizovicinus DSM 16549]|uniref:Uncharacterized protein n=1 Tax=Luteibacter rhizovicinus DSM 16549 TaxID=1440763 RepID=A0A0G9H8Y1_9GAMM|nr:hypothetical protein BJI69_11405 [Luteibacter rhizovicinus DSM 16549]KLD66255.1 hypothetical protein Y883_14690 [Luteibacter rhizovicinus DSM 16549]
MCFDRRWISHDPGLIVRSQRQGSKTKKRRISVHGIRYFQRERPHTRSFAGTYVVVTGWKSAFDQSGKGSQNRPANVVDMDEIADLEAFGKRNVFASEKRFAQGWEEAVRRFPWAKNVEET